MSTNLPSPSHDSPSPALAKGGNLRCRFFFALARFCALRPGSVLGVSLLVTLLAGVAIVREGKVVTGRDQLSDPSKKYNQDMNTYKERFGTPNSVVMVVGGGTKGSREAFIQAFAEQVTGEERDAVGTGQQLVREVFFRRGLDVLARHGLYYIDLPELRQWIAGMSQGNGDWLKPGVHKSLPRLLKTLAESLPARRDGKSGMPDIRRKALLGILTGFVQNEAEKAKTDSKVQEAATGRSFYPPLPERYRSSSASASDFLMSEDGTLHMAIITPARTTLDMASLIPLNARLRGARDALAERFPELTVGFTGYPALIHDETRTITADLPWTSAAALVLIALIFLTALRPLRWGLAAIVTLVLAVSWSLGATFLVVGHLNAVTSVIMAILFGLGIDFGIHLVARFQEERAGGWNREKVGDRLGKVLSETGSAIFAGGLTSAAAFFALATNEFDAFAELGIIAGMGLLLCMVAMITLLPSLLVLSERSGRGGEAGDCEGPSEMTTGSLAMADAVGNEGGATPGPSLLPLPEHGKRGSLIFIAALVLSLCAGLATPRIDFNYNIQNLQAHKTEAVETAKLLSRFSYSANAVVRTCGSIEEVDRISRQLQTLDSVGRVESVRDVIPEDLEEKEEVLQDFRRKLLMPVAASATVTKEQDLQSVLRTLTDQSEDTEVASLAKRALAYLLRLGAFGGAYSRAYEQGVSASLQGRQRKLSQFLEAGPPSLANFPNAISRRYISADSRYYALHVHARGSMWDRDFLDRFISEVERVDPRATGFPVLYRQITHEIRRGAESAAVLACIAVLIVLVLDMRSLWSCALSIVPVGLGVVWTLGLMGATGIRFNLANVVAIPLILGIGIDSGIHIVHRYTAGGDDPLGAAKAALRPITLTTLTTMAGFGALALASHRGLQSLGLVMLIGLASSWVAAVVVLPALLFRYGGNEDAA